jgi:hypothetical protein
MYITYACHGMKSIYLPDVLKNVSFGFMDMFWLAELMASLAM